MAASTPEARTSSNEACHDRAVRTCLHKRDPLGTLPYAWEYDFSDDVFRAQQIAAHFNNVTPDRENADEGMVYLGPPGGRLISTIKQSASPSDRLSSCFMTRRWL